MLPVRQRLRWRSHGRQRQIQPAPEAGLAPRLSIGFILAHRFTLCAFGNFVDVLRLAADEGDRSRPILCDWTVLSDTMNPVVSSCGVPVQPTERLSDPTNSTTSWWSAD